MKKALSFRFSAEVHRLLDALKAKLGISMTAIMELAIREFAEKHGIK